MGRGTSKIGGSRSSGAQQEERMEIARMMTFGTANNRDIVRRLMATQDSFKNMSFADAMKTFKSYEKDGLVRRTAQYIVIEHVVGNKQRKKK